MNYKVELTAQAIQVLFADQNRLFNTLKSYFPKLKIVVRNNFISAEGEEADVDIFKGILQRLLETIYNQGGISSVQLEEILDQKPIQKMVINGDAPLLHGAGGKMIYAKTENLKQLVKLSETNDMVFAVGPAGTGKTYTSVALAVRALKQKEVKRIILTRPAVEAGESLGFLPGDLKEKLDPYLQPLYDALRDMISAEKLQDYLAKSIVEVAPLAFMRGRTLDHAFVILDEAQNTTHSQMKMFLTRMGKNAKFIITGDPSQIDLPHYQKSGLKEAMKILQGVEGIGFIHLNESDVVRHPLVRKILHAYAKTEID